MAKKDIIVVGASAGGLNALMELVKKLPSDFPASIFIVQHISPAAPSYLPRILNKDSAVECVHPKDGQKIEKGKIYIAPPDHHLLLEKNSVLVKRGPKENRFRPSVDALFRSAAYNYGTRAIGIVLSGLLDDGTSGLWSIKRLGGTTIVQSPEDALYPDMPVNALEYVEANYILPVAEMGTKLVNLVSEEASAPPAIPIEDIGRIETELRIASQTMNTEMLSLKLGEPSRLTCPECNGTLSRIEEKKIIRYRCHTGHAFTENALLADVTKGIEEDLWKALRGLDESILILEEMAARATNGIEAPVKTLQQKISEAKKHSLAIRETLISNEQFSADKLSNNNKTAVNKESAGKKKRKS
jgi:two-component system chemotaxis response regulator CheB